MARLRGVGAAAASGGGSGGDVDWDCPVPPASISAAAVASAGGEAFVKLKIAEALQGKDVYLLPVSEGGMNLKTTNINDLINTMGIRKLSDESRKPVDMSGSPGR